MDLDAEPLILGDLLLLRHSNQDTDPTGPHEGQGFIEMQLTLFVDGPR
jgi:hypothetical protein